MMIGQQDVALDGNKVEENSNVHVVAFSNGVRNWWSRRSSFEKILASLCLLLMVMCTAFVIVHVISQGRLRIAERIISETCYSKECIQAASRILDKMNPMVEPCDNFYEFACGNYVSRNTVPDDNYYKSAMQTMQEDIFVKLKKLMERPVTSNDSEATSNAKKLYTSCMNTSIVEEGSVKVLRELLTNRRIGEWPALQPKWGKKQVDLEWRLAMLHVHQVQPLIQFSLAPDERNSSVYLLDVYSGFLMLNKKYYLNNTNPDHVRYIMSYKNLIAETLHLLKAQDSTVESDVEALLEFEVKLANISRDDPSERNDTNSRDEDPFNRINISKLEEIIPEIKWGFLIDYIFDNIGLSTQKGDLNIVLHCKKYLRNLVLLINATSPRTVANYLTWRFVAKYLPYLDIHFRRLFHDFCREVPNFSEERIFFARWKECVNIVNSRFGMAVTSLYVREEFGEDKQKEIETLISSLRHSFIEGIQKQTWLDSETKSVCEEKVLSMNTKLGFPRYILDPVQLDATYSGLDISEDNFLDNILKMNRHEVKKEMSNMTSTGDKDRDWIMIQPLESNAFYMAFRNEMFLPVGVLRTPIFAPERPKYLNYGILGVLIGHEITHGFDNTGRKFDKDGNLTEWWTDDMVEKFTEQADCFVEQYSQLPIDTVGQNVNGNETLGDNICDNSGLKQAYRAYVHYVSQYGEEPSLPGISYNNLQVFFLQSAQLWCEVLSKEAYERYTKESHSPGKYRTNIPLMNSPEFSSVFNCPVGSPMNPRKKCILWG